MDTMLIVQIIGVITGVVSVFFTMKQNILCWVFGIASCIFLSVFFYYNGFKGQFILQAVSLIQCIVGWVQWKRVDNKEVKKQGLFLTLYLVVFGVVGGIAFTVLTVPNSNDVWVYLDGIGAGLALIATYLLIIKDIHAWLFFMVNNLIIIALSIHLHNMYWIAGLNGSLFIMSIFGYIEWKKNLKTV